VNEYEVRKISLSVYIMNISDFVTCNNIYCERSVKHLLLCEDKGVDLCCVWN